MSSRARLKGRSERAERHIRLAHWVMETEAWRDLDPVARCSYIELVRKYAGPGSNNGKIAVSVRQLRDELKISTATASRALQRLEDHGFIVVMEKGSFTRKIRHATQYRLTEFGCDVTNTLATKDFSRWRKSTVSQLKQSVSLVKPCGTSGETTTPAIPPKNPLHSFTTDTDSTRLGISSETLIDNQGVGVSRSGVQPRRRHHGLRVAAGGRS
ncbi:MAG TPA: MarR family transcriptional regulator [Nevskia sp.]|nr:MarR family transcriptional regulator [Nevskia sp.]